MGRVKKYVNRRRVMELLAGTGVVMVVFIMALRWAYRAGQENARRGREEEINDAARKALRHHDRLLHDPDYAERVRRRFTR